LLSPIAYVLSLIAYRSFPGKPRRLGPPSN
jgi:hypothetical protein